ncbi:MAG: PH domain-containing protein [Actinobacteria bacterium]|nr:PH domain-containing protein [Actinomycetota bacterium]MBO0834138.1 PH domain-containing protein [Actinomycetota bacterium]
MADGLAEGEHPVLQLHPHWKTVLRPLTILAGTVIVLLVVLVLLRSMQNAGTVRLGLVVLAILIILWFTAMPLLRWLTTSYELTTRRLRLRSGIFSRSGRDFPLLRISDVSFAQGPLDRLLGCGRLVVESPGEHGQLVLTEIPHVQHVQATMFQLVEDEQQRLARED